MKFSTILSVTSISALLVAGCATPLTTGSTGGGAETSQASDPINDPGLRDRDNGNSGNSGGGGGSGGGSSGGGGTGGGGTGGGGTGGGGTGGGGTGGGGGGPGGGGGGPWG